MENKKNKYSLLQRVQRVFKLNFYKLFRSPGGSKKVALGFAIGLGIEMLVICTASLIYLLFYPIVRLAGGSFPAAIIGNVIGKLTFLPVVLLPIAHVLGKTLYPIKVQHSPAVHHHFHHSFAEIFSGNFLIILKDLLSSGMYTLIGMTIFGIVLGFISYFVVHHLYEKERSRRLQRRKKETEIAIMRT